MKTKEELNALKEEVETLNNKLAELTKDELEQVTGGTEPFCPNDKDEITWGKNHTLPTVGGVCGQNTGDYYYPPKDDELNPYW